MLKLGELNYKKIILAVIILLAGGFLLASVVWLLFFSQPEGEVIEKGEVFRVEPGGVLPVTQEATKTNLILSGGRLVSEKQKLINNYKSGARELLSKRANGALTKVDSLINEEVAAINYTKQGFIFLSRKDNYFYYLTADGRRIKLSDEEFPFVERAVWSNDGNKVILEYPDGANILYDFTRRKKITLPAEARDFSFDVADERIAYKFVTDDVENNWIVVSDTQNTQIKPVEPIGDKAASVQVAWSPNNQVVALYHESRGLDKEEVYFLGLHDENFRSLKVAGSNFKGIWSPDGKQILYHVINPDNSYNPMLWVASAEGDKIGLYNYNLGLTTWVDKCAFAPGGQELYCAVPVSLKKGAGLYPEIVNDSEDVFYKIDLRTGISHLIAYPVFSEDLDKFQAQEVFVSQDGSKLYFWDKWTQRVYFMYLK